LVGVFVGVFVGVLVGVLVGVFVGVLVGVFVEVAVEVLATPLVGVPVGGGTVLHPTEICAPLTLSAIDRPLGVWTSNPVTVCDTTPPLIVVDVALTVRVPAPLGNV
jgi:ABC-type dipeptide/oligopeptide/nickel transport system permease subunit